MEGSGREPSELVLTFWQGNLIRFLYTIIYSFFGVSCYPSTRIPQKHKHKAHQVLSQKPKIVMLPFLAH